MQKKLNIGILSTADIATKVSQAIQCSKNAIAYAVASRQLDKAQEWAKKHNVQIAYGSYQELLDDKNVDALYIPLPTSLKKEWAIKGAQSKKHILLEKPLPGLDNTNDLEEIINECKKNNVQFLDGTMWLHSIRTQEIKQKKQEIGQIRIVNTAFTFKAPSEEWLHGGNGRTNKNQEPMGILGDQGWYPVGAILFAYDYDLPLRVRSLYCLKNKVDTIIQASAFLEFSGGRIAYLDIGVTSPHRSYFEFVGENAVLRIDDQVGGQGKTGNFQAYFENFEGSTRYFIDDAFGKETQINVQGSNHTKLMIENFSSIILGQNVDYEWAKRSLHTQKVLAGLYKSVENNGEIINLS